MIKKLFKSESRIVFLIPVVIIWALLVNNTFLSEKPAEGRRHVIKETKNNMQRSHIDLDYVNDQFGNNLEVDKLDSVEVVEQLLSLRPVNLHQLVLENEVQLKDFFEVGEKLTSGFVQCLLQSNDICGQVPDEALDNVEAFIDPNSTIIHMYLNRALLVMSLSIEIDKSYIQKLDQRILMTALKIKNSNTQVQATELLMKMDLDRASFQEVLSKTKFMEGKTRAMAFGLLSSNKNYASDFREELFSSLSDTRDRKTALDINSRLAQMHLSAEDYREAIKVSCHLRSDGTVENRWPDVRAKMLRQIRLAGLQVSPNEVCL